MSSKTVGFALKASQLSNSLGVGSSMRAASCNLRSLETYNLKEDLLHEGGELIGTWKRPNEASSSNGQTGFGGGEAGGFDLRTLPRNRWEEQQQQSGPGSNQKSTSMDWLIQPKQ
eukprot:TRINITY_DN11158_c0_g1_i1.p1 TRINITY_DN11158_c0_g1~~TRINITY_DN11158_c0_g1_i1.p1  ORF type:complete len:130 (+),score=38.95 TRINITY_DN11158_c0_g1_i1:47-391(+)